MKPLQTQYCVCNLSKSETLNGFSTRRTFGLAVRMGDDLSRAL
jgi:hypothetical protein